MNPHGNLGIRWTLGDVSQAGFDALNLSLWGAWRLFGEGAKYVVCVNSIPLEKAQLRVGETPPAIQWHDATGDLPAFIRDRMDANMAEGVGWKFAPIRKFDGFELALDNDCILWDVPRAIRDWLKANNPHSCVIAEDVRRCLGQFDRNAPTGAFNSGIRGLPPNSNFESTLKSFLTPGFTLQSELDEQGLQIAALSRAAELLLVRVEEVSICSPFPPHQPGLGTCGAHFVGLNAKKLPWTLDGRSISESIHRHWISMRDEVAKRVFDTKPTRETL